ncbi:MAG: Mur ligase domain-containing protein, partial [Acidimicrobiia bacterium]
MKLTRLLARVPGLVEVIGNVDGLAIDSVTLDHRNVAPGIAFACVAGARFDGNAFAEDAVASGAPVVFSERPLALSVPVVLVVNVNEAIGEIAAALEGDPSRTLMCFGVTGTNGKTTTTYLLDGISAAGGHPSAILGTTGVRIGSKTLATGFTTPQAPELQHL